MCDDNGMERALRSRRSEPETRRLGPNPAYWGGQSLWGTVRSRDQSKSHCDDELEGEGREAKEAGYYACDQLE